MTTAAFMAFPCIGGFAGGLIFTRKRIGWYNVSKLKFLDMKICD